jgi:hypothetical protein
MTDTRTSRPRRPRIDPLAVARALVADRAAQVAGADEPAAALPVLAELERAAAKARMRLAVHLVLDEGWSYARLGRALGTSRQAATKVYGPAVRHTQRTRLRRRPEQR